MQVTWLTCVAEAKQSTRQMFSASFLSLRNKRTGRKQQDSQGNLLFFPFTLWMKNQHTNDAYAKKPKARITCTQVTNLDPITTHILQTTKEKKFLFAKQIFCGILCQHIQHLFLLALNDILLHLTFWFL